MSGVSCDGSEFSLSSCSFPGWGNISGCTHKNDVGIVCTDSKLIFSCHCQVFFHFLVHAHLFRVCSCGLCLYFISVSTCDALWLFFIVMIICLLFID